MSNNERKQNDVHRIYVRNIYCWYGRICSLGLLTQIASDMKVSISSAGLLISVYAISVAVMGPFMRIFTLKVHGHRLLPILVAIFIISNLVGMLAPNFNVLLLSRLMSAAMHAPFFGVCMSVAAAVAPPQRNHKRLH